MAGVSQVWLTAEELEATATAFDMTERYVGKLTPTERAALKKIERALAPVACDTASGSKTP